MSGLWAYPNSVHAAAAAAPEVEALVDVDLAVLAAVASLNKMKNKVQRHTR